MSQHLVSHIRNSELEGDNTLHVVGIVTNYVRWHSRYRLFRQWYAEMMATPNVKVYVVECAYGSRAFECTDPSNPQHIQVRTNSEIWIKENLGNLGIRRAIALNPNAKYFCFSDTDIHFRNPSWAQATLHELQHVHILQPWKDALDLDFHGGVHGHHVSFGYLCATGKKMWHGKGKPGYHYGHTGFAIAFTRYWYENVQKLLDFCIIGSGDHHILWGCLGMIRSTIHSGVCDDYYNLCDLWQQKAQFACASHVRYVHGRIEHHFHGPKGKPEDSRGRQYWSRWDILINNNFNPVTDLCFDSQGVLQLCGTNKYSLERDIMTYNRNRMEDSIEL